MPCGYDATTRDAAGAAPPGLAPGREAPPHGSCEPIVIVCGRGERVRTSVGRHRRRRQGARGRPVAVYPKGLAVLLIRREDELFAIANKCAHMGCPLEGGKLEGFTLDVPVPRLALRRPRRRVPRRRRSSPSRRTRSRSRTARSSCGSRRPDMARRGLPLRPEHLPVVPQGQAVVHRQPGPVRVRRRRPAAQGRRAGGGRREGAIELSGGRRFPVVVINGEVVVGYNTDRFLELLKSVG